MTHRWLRRLFGAVLLVLNVVTASLVAPPSQSVQATPGHAHAAVSAEICDHRVRPTLARNLARVLPREAADEIAFSAALKCEWKYTHNKFTYRKNNPADKAEAKRLCELAGELLLDDPENPNVAQYQCVDMGDGYALWIYVCEIEPKAEVNVSSGLCLDVPNSSTSAGTRLQQYFCNGTGAQRWITFYQRNGWFWIINVTSFHCLGTEAGSTAAGAAIIQWPCNNNLDQQWRFDWSFGEHRIRNHKSGHLMVVQNGSWLPGALIIQWPNNGAPDQIWHY